MFDSTIRIIIIGIFLNISCTSKNNNFEGGYKYNDSTGFSTSDSTLNEFDSLEQELFNKNKIKISPVIQETIEY